MPRIITKNCSSKCGVCFSIYIYIYAGKIHNKDMIDMNRLAHMGALYPVVDPQILLSSSVRSHQAPAVCWPHRPPCHREPAHNESLHLTKLGPSQLTQTISNSCTPRNSPGLVSSCHASSLHASVVGLWLQEVPDGFCLKRLGPNTGGNSGHQGTASISVFWLLVAMPFVTSSFFFLVARPGATSSVLATSSDALCY